jgi:hypothetical protein
VSPDLQTFQNFVIRDLTAAAKRGQRAHGAYHPPHQRRTGGADRRLIFASQVFLNV